MPGIEDPAAAAAASTSDVASATGGNVIPAGESPSAASVPEPSGTATADAGSQPSNTGSSGSPAGGPSTNEFAPSLLDEAAAKPATEPSKPADAAPDPGAAKPADAQPPATPAPAAADGQPQDQVQPGADGEPAAPPAPIEYAFTMDGEGGERVPLDLAQVDAERMGAFTGLLNEARVAPDVAQKFVDMHLQEMRRVADHIATHQWEVFREQQRQAREEVMADPVLGGSRHDTAMKTIMSAIDRWSMRPTDQQRSAEAIQAERQQLMDDFRATGIANRRSLLSLLHYFGDAFVKEAQPRPAPPPRTPAPGARDRATSRYGNTTPR